MNPRRVKKVGKIKPQHQALLFLFKSRIRLSNKATDCLRQDGFDGIVGFTAAVVANSAEESESISSPDMLCRGPIASSGVLPFATIKNIVSSVVTDTPYAMILLLDFSSSKNVIRETKFWAASSGS